MAPFKSQCEEITCSICLEIAWNPVTCAKCTSPFGKACINKWNIQKPGNCPKGCIYDQHEFPLILKRLVNKIEFKCINFDRGCKEVLLYDNFYNHMSSCVFTPYCCIYPGCGYKGDKKALLEHSKVCQKFIKHCKGCRLQLNRADYVAHKENKNGVCAEKCSSIIANLFAQNDTLKKENRDLKIKLDFEFNKPILFKIESREIPENILKLIRDKKCTHDLMLEDHTEGRFDISCDNCNKEFLMITISCRICNFDLCLNCYRPNEMYELIKCTKNHNLVAFNFTYDQIQINCQKCKVSVKQTFCFDCRECNYSLCYQCYCRNLKRTKRFYN